MTTARPTAKVGWGSFLGGTHRLLVDVMPVIPPLIGLYDLSVVTGASFRVTSPSRGVLTWTAEFLATPTATLVRLAHTYLSDDLPTAERMKIVVLLTIPGYVVDCDVVILDVLQD